MEAGKGIKVAAAIITITMATERRRKLALFRDKGLV
jgi:hypothetical protein